MPEQKESKGTDLILLAIEKSPLTSDVKQKVGEVVRQNSAELNRLAYEAKYRAPETDFESEITASVGMMIQPVMAESSVPLPNGRNTIRHIYQALGGRRPVQYE